MPSRRKSIPSYLPHRQSGRARVVWRDILGIRHQQLLPGPYNSPESLEAFARMQLELATRPSIATASESVTIAEVLVSYLDHAERYYVHADGSPTSEIRELKASVRVVRETYGSITAADFGPKKLAAVRQRMIELGWCRQLVNRRVDRVKRIFKWATSEELIPVTVYQSLRTLPGLRAGRSDAPEAQPVRPVADDVVAATLPHLPGHIRVMVEILRLTGMRPAEVCGMTLRQIDQGGELWVFSPVQHKTRHHGKGRVIPIGPKALAVLNAHLANRNIKPDDPIFSPRVAREERFAAMRINRKSKVPPSQVSRKRAKPKLLPAMWYTPGTISHAVKKAAEKAGVESWFPYQLRHTHGTKVRREFGLEAAGATLGHTKMSATEVYAERDESLAVEIAKKIG